MTSAAKERAERRAVARGGGPDDRPPKLTLYGIAAGEADLVGGRYGAISKTEVTGKYPAQPADSWPNATILPDEPPLGFSVEDHPAVGEAFEIERSMREVSTDAGQTPLASESDLANGDVRSAPGRSSGGVAAPSPLSKRKSRKRG